MGAYNYFLTTKSRRLKVKGVPKEFYLLKFAGKVTSPTPKSVRMTEARLERAWSGRAAPEYVVYGEFEDGFTVFRDWPAEHGVLVGEGYIEKRLVAGYLRGTGRTIKFEPWTTLCFDLPPMAFVRPGLPDNPEYQNTIARANADLKDSGLMSGKFHTSVRKQPGFGTPDRFCVTIREELDVVRAKLVLSGLNVIVYEA